MRKKERFTTYDVVTVGVMAAVIFAATFFLKIGPIPLPLGDPTMLKLANALCLLGGLLFGGLRGGLAAGIGSAMFDLTNPIYMHSAPFTFAFFFVMAFVAGGVSHMGKTSSFKKDLVGAVLGAVCYTVLYITKSVLVLVLAGSALPAAIAACAVKVVVSTANGLLGIVVSVALAPIFRKALSRAGQGMRRLVSY